MSQFLRFLRRPIALYSVLGVALALAIGWYFTHRAIQVAAAPPPAEPSVGIVQARVGTFAVRVSAEGRIGPPAGSDAKLAFPIAGIVHTIDVRVGDRVTVGQVVAELARSGLAISVRQAEADAAAAAAGYAGGTLPAAAAQSARAKLAVAEAHLAGLQRGGQAAQSDRIAAASVARQAALKVEQDQRVLERERTLLAGGVPAQKDVDTAQALLAADLADQRAADAKVAAAGVGFEAALRQAQADVAQAQADLQTAQSQGSVLAAQARSASAKLAGAEHDYTSGLLRAPNDGVVVAILKHEGEWADSTMPVIDVAPLSGSDVTFTAAGSKARRIKVGDRAELSTGRAARPAHGVVIAVVPAVDPTTQTTTVVVRGVPRDALPGDAVTATIVVANRRGVIVPANAVVQDPQSGNTVVFIREAHGTDPSFRSQDVRVGASDGSSALISSGLEPGQEIAAQGAYDLLAPNGS